MNEFKFSPGLRDESSGQPIDGSQIWMDKIWKVRRWQIERHLADFADNGQIDAPEAAIFSWPGAGNPHFVDQNGFDLPARTAGWAPFFDQNGNGKYEPLAGDFPKPVQLGPNSPLPEQILWHSVGDFGKGGQSLPLGLELQRTTWSIHCPDLERLNRTVFSSDKWVNLSGQPFTDSRIVFINELKAYCASRIYVGIDTAQNAVFPTRPRSIRRLIPALGIRRFPRLF